jgi:type II secretory ATPase GspE/PulE/Tfp pilus assembly ATPase PilB-like protein
MWDPVWRQVLSSSSAPSSYPRAPLAWHTYDPSLSPLHMVENWQAVIFQHDQNIWHLAMHDPGDICTRDAIARWIVENFGVHHPTWHMYQSDMEDIRIFMDPSYTSSGTATSSCPLLEQLLRSGVMHHASDIHIHPQSDSDWIRFRIHGQLVEWGDISKQESQTLMNRLKVLSNLHITETRRPQSGRFSYGDVEVRTAFQVTILGESAVLRLLPRQRAIMPLSQLGLTPEQQITLREVLQMEHGLFVCCGATGAGKTTTLYALLAELDPHEHNIMTLEDPVEYPMPFIRQTEVKPGVLDFAEGVRALLRHDPDVMLIGEIRDADTAQMAVRAAMTGHLVLTTLHTHDVWSIPGRLIDFGVSPTMIGGHLLGAMHQKLVPHAEYGRILQAQVLRTTPALQQAISQGIWGLPLKEMASVI